MNVVVSQQSISLRFSAYKRPAKERVQGFKVQIYSGEELEPCADQAGKITQ